MCIQAIYLFDSGDRMSLQQTIAIAPVLFSMWGIDSPLFPGALHSNTSILLAIAPVPTAEPSALHTSSFGHTLPVISNTIIQGLRFSRSLLSCEP
jgi:hypothetical protein